MFLQDEKRKWNRFSSTETSSKGILLTRDYLNYLMKEHNFQIKKISKIYFYKKCHILPQIFQELVNVRALPTTSKEEKTLLKNIVNYSTGFFGYNELKHNIVSSCRLVTQIPKRYHINKLNSQIKLIGCVNNTDILFVKVNKPKQKKRFVSHSALPIYISITEWGKKRMAEIFCFFEKYLLPEKFCLVYSNVDNALICLSTDTLDEAVNPKYRKQFLAKKSEFFGIQGSISGS